jgi:hypothetical protein
MARQLPDPHDIDESVNLLHEDRQKHWKDFIMTKIRQLQDNLQKPYLNRKELARLLNTTDTSIKRWVENGEIPSRIQVFHLSTGFASHGVHGSDIDWLEAAGYDIMEDESYNTAQKILNAINAATDISEEDRTRLDHALVASISPEWRRLHPFTLSLISTVLNNKKMVWMDKADYIYGLVTLAKDREAW